MCVPMNPAPPVTSTLLLSPAAPPPPPLPASAPPIAMGPADRSICAVGWVYVRRRLCVRRAWRAVRCCCTCTGGVVGLCQLGAPGRAGQYTWGWVRCPLGRVPRPVPCRNRAAQRDGLTHAQRSEAKPDGGRDAFGLASRPWYARGWRWRVRGSPLGRLHAANPARSPGYLLTASLSLIPSDRCGG